MGSLLDLPRNSLYVTIANLSLKNLVHFCRTSKYANLICGSEGFWKYKFMNEFGIEYPSGLVYLSGLEFEPIVVYLLYKRQEQMNKLDVLDASFLNVVLSRYLSSLLVDKKEQAREAFEQSFVREQIHRSQLFDVLVVNSSESEFHDVNEFKLVRDENRKLIIRSIKETLMNAGVKPDLEMKPIAGFDLVIYTLLYNHRKGQEPIYKKIQDINRLIIRLKGVGSFDEIVNKFDGA